MNEETVAVWAIVVGAKKNAKMIIMASHLSIRHLSIFRLSHACPMLSPINAHPDNQSSWKERTRCD